MYFLFSEDRCLNRCNISFAISRVEDCLELNFKYVDYQSLAHLSYSSCVCLTFVRAARAQRFLSVRVLISDSTVYNFPIFLHYLISVSVLASVKLVVKIHSNNVASHRNICGFRCLD